MPLHLVRVADAADLPDLPQVLGSEAVARELVAAEAMAREYLARVGACLSGRGLAVTTEVRRRGAGRQILATVRSGDLVVIAACGRGGRGDGLGSVAEGVVERAQVPVVVVPAYDG